MRNVIPPIRVRLLKSKRATFFLAAFVAVIAFQNCSVGKFETTASKDFSSTGFGCDDDPNWQCTNSPGVEEPIPIPDPVPTSTELKENPNADVWPESAVEGIHPAEIFQRKDSGKANITITLKQAVPAHLIYFSVASLSTDGSKDAVLVSGMRNGKTDFTFALATGMASRKVRLSLYDADGLEQIRWSSPGFSVGEVFLVSGQSNATTHGQGASASKSILNRGVDPVSKTWVQLKDPLPYGSSYAMAPWNNPGFDSGSPWPSFSDELSSQLGVPVAIILVGWGGTGAGQWLPGQEGDYFTRMVLGARSVPKCGFRAVFWHQGESESIGKVPAAEYQSVLQNLVGDFRSSTGCSQPWMIARVSYLGLQYWTPAYNLSLDQADAVRWSSELEVRKAQNALAQMPGFFAGPDTDLLIASKYRFDDLHFSAEGLALHGRLWAQRVLGMFNRPMQTEKDLVPEVKTVWSVMKANLPRTDAEMQADSEGVRYWTKMLSTGKISADAMAKVFRDSDEAFIRQVFQEGFGRQPTATELTYWTQQASQKSVMTREQLKAAILKSK